MGKTANSLFGQSAVFPERETACSTNNTREWLHRLQRVSVRTSDWYKRTAFGMMLSHVQWTLIPWKCLSKNRVSFISPFSDLKTVHFPTGFHTNKNQHSTFDWKGVWCTFQRGSSDRKYHCYNSWISSLLYIERSWHYNREKPFLCQLIPVKCNFLNTTDDGGKRFIRKLSSYVPKYTVPYSPSPQKKNRTV